MVFEAKPEQKSYSEQWDDIDSPVLCCGHEQVRCAYRYTFLSSDLRTPTSLPVRSWTESVTSKYVPTTDFFPHSSHHTGPKVKLCYGTTVVPFFVILFGTYLPFINVRLLSFKNCIHLYKSNLTSFSKILMTKIKRKIGMSKEE